ncbi:DUF1707 domain-containing protein [Plantactinospora sp. B6F1]|uniref:DUF1707 domain-containing protein n=1 Tax=Plantactinospora sp. B6F1 TaxID=3158971 RepID=UPI00102C6564
MRAADSDRAAVADQLRQALNEGRLDLGEYDDRLQRAYAAKTYGDLDGLLTDLPGTVPVDQAGLVPAGAPEPPVFRAEPAVRYPGATRAWLVETWEGYLGLVGVVVTIWAVTSALSADLLYFWPGWVAGPLGAMLLLRTVTGLAKGEPQRWAAEQAAKRQAKIEKRARTAERKRRLDEQGGQEELA